MTAYRTASRLFPGLHLAALGMGMEYSQMGNLQVRRAAALRGVPQVGACSCASNVLLCFTQGHKRVPPCIGGAPGRRTRRCCPV